MKLGWTSDIHLDHLRVWPGKRHKFARDCAEQTDALAITGDITTQVDTSVLEQFAKRYGKPIYFVMGNHDYWGGSFLEAENRIRALCKKHKNLHWLTPSAPINLTPNTQILGVEGWYDAKLGDPWRGFEMVDWRAISDFRMNHLWDVIAKVEQLAKGYAVMALGKLDASTAKNLIFLTHVPPFPEVAVHRGQPTSIAALPWYTNATLGEALAKWTEQNTDRTLLTLCGHTHATATYQAAENHLVQCAAAEYGEPTLFRVFDLDQ